MHEQQPLGRRPVFFTSPWDFVLQDPANSTHTHSQTTHFLAVSSFTSAHPQALRPTANAHSKLLGHRSAFHCLPAPLTAHTSILAACLPGKLATLPQDSV